MKKTDSLRLLLLFFFIYPHMPIYKVRSKSTETDCLDFLESKTEQLTLKVESKVLQYFGNMRHNLVDAFVKVVRIMNPNRQWDTELAWFSPSVYSLDLPHGLEHSLRINGFRPAWSCQIIKLLVTQAKFLEPSNNCAVINCPFTFHTMNVFGCFHIIMAKFEFIDNKLPN